MRSITLVFSFLFLLACSAESPTQLDSSALQADQALMSNGATGAIPGEPDDLGEEIADADENENDFVCVKTVPGGNGRAAPRTIIKDDEDGECPGGFDRIPVGGDDPPVPF